MAPTTFHYTSPSPSLPPPLCFHFHPPFIFSPIFTLTFTITMTSIFQKQKSLPVSHTTTQHPPPPPTTAGIRRRLSSSSFQIQPPTISSTTAWALRSTKSVSSIGESASTSIKNWWNRGCGWILSRKPVFAQDLEMNHEETSVLGCHNKGSWRHIFYKIRSEIKKLIRSDQSSLPQTIRTKTYSSAI